MIDTFITNTMVLSRYYNAGAAGGRCDVAPSRCAGAAGACSQMAIDIIYISAMELHGMTNE